MDAFIIIGSVFVFIAAVIHILIFFLESVLWSRPETWRRFGITSQEDADTIRPMAFNQGFYNLFLAIGAGIGLVMLGSGTPGGAAIALFATGSMVAASLVLFFTNRTLLRAVLLQGAAPLVGIIFLSIALATA